ncbi:putative NAC domain protein [Quillaja saponaria]|nr:putative NAC domain protein [Quillaja saponaria]
MSSPPKSPTMESNKQNLPNIKPSVTNQEVLNMPTKREPQSSLLTDNWHLLAPSQNPYFEFGTTSAANPASNSTTPSSLVSSDHVHDSEDEIEDVNQKIILDYEHAYLSSFPPGYRFCPTDEELIIYYLKNKVDNVRLPRNQIVDVQLYQHHPEDLCRKFKEYGEKEWYFFTPRDRKYRNGSRPKRSAAEGYWKATGADRSVKSVGAVVGYRKALVFYEGKPPKGDKTNWIMHEYRVNDPPRTKRGTNDMRLDDWVLCRVYKKTDKSYRSRNRNGDDDDDHNYEESEEARVEMDSNDGASNDEGFDPAAANLVNPFAPDFNYSDQNIDDVFPLAFLPPLYDNMACFPDQFQAINNNNHASSSTMASFPDQYIQAMNNSNHASSSTMASFPDQYIQAMNNSYYPSSSTMASVPDQYLQGVCNNIVSGASRQFQAMNNDNVSASTMARVPDQFQAMGNKNYGVQPSFTGPPVMQHYDHDEQYGQLQDNNWGISNLENFQR